jgi:NDP-sugar pyrophosphorylase family protein
MIKVLDKPFLEYQLEFLKKQGIQDVVLCTGHLKEQIEDYFGDGNKFGVNIKYSHEDKLLGTAGAIKNAKHLLHDVFFSLYGDSYLFLDFQAALAFFKSKNKLALMSVYKNYDRYDRSNTAVEGELVRKHSKEERAEDMVYIEYGANIFRKEVLELIPEDRPYSLSELFAQLIEKEELVAYEVKERFYEIGSPSGLEELEEFARNVLHPKSVVFNQSKPGVSDTGR